MVATTGDRDGLSRTTSYAYDASARLTQITAPEGNNVQYAYDARGNATTTTNVAKAGSGLASIVSSASFDASCTNIVKCNKPNSTTDAKSDDNRNVWNQTSDKPDDLHHVWIHDLNSPFSGRLTKLLDLARERTVFRRHVALDVGEAPVDVLEARTDISRGAGG